MVQKLKSRKLIALLIGVLLHVGNGYLGNPIDEETMGEVTKLILGYLLGQGLADLGKEGQIFNSFGRQVGEAVKTAAVEKKELAEDDAGPS